MIHRHSKLTAAVFAAAFSLSAGAAYAQDQAAGLAGGAWSPYVVGALIGLLSMLTFYFSKHPLGASTAYARIAGLIGKQVAPAHTMRLTYFSENKPKVGWELMLVMGVVFGGWLAAMHGGEITGQLVPEMWASHFGVGQLSVAMRILAALGGGVLMAFGARLAGGCTSGHGISGTLQLAVGSWIAAIGIFLGGIAAAAMLFAV